MAGMIAGTSHADIDIWRLGSSGNDNMDILLHILKIAPWVISFYFALNAFTTQPLPGMKKLSEKIDRQDLSTLFFSIIFILALFYGITQALKFFLMPFTGQ